MIQVYASLIKNGTVNPKTGKVYTIEDVPAIIRSKVQELLSGGGENAE